MLKILSQKKSTLMLNDSEPNKIVESVKKYITTSGCKNLTVDISGMNIIDACKISVLCSTEHYLQHPDGQINWVVSSSSVEKMVSSMGLGNSSFLYK